MRFDFYTDPRKGQTVICHPYDQRIYMYGGLCRKVIHDVEAYDHHAGTW